MAIPKNLLWSGGVVSSAAIASAIVFAVDVANISAPDRVAPPAQTADAGLPAPKAAAIGAPGIVASSVAPGPAPATAPQSQTPAPASGKRPSFDVARISPQGETVVAGRAAPNASVVLLDQGRQIASGLADADGQFVIIPPALPPGDHLLTLRAGGPQNAVDSEQNVAAVVATRQGGPAFVALASPSEPTRVLNEVAPPPAGRPATPVGATKGAPAPAVAILSADAGEDGSFLASGAAAAGAAVRLYLNNSFVAAVQANHDGQWSLQVQHGMNAGHYDIRADVVESGGGKVVARAEAPFDYPEPSKSGASSAATAVPAAQPAQQAGIAGPTPERAIVADLQTVTVARGDSLWRISRRVLGRGIRYTQIYEANAGQIRDPDRIWPGQVFVTPASRAD